MFVKENPDRKKPKKLRRILRSQKITSTVFFGESKRSLESRSDELKSYVSFGKIKPLTVAPELVTLNYNFMHVLQSPNSQLSAISCLTVVIHEAVVLHCQIQVSIGPTPLQNLRITHPEGVEQKYQIYKCVHFLKLFVTGNFAPCGNVECSGNVENTVQSCF